MITTQYKNNGEKPLEYSVSPTVPFNVTVEDDVYTFTFPQQELPTSTVLTLKNDCGQVNYAIDIPAKCSNVNYSISQNSIGKGAIEFGIDNFEEGDIVLWSYPELNYNSNESTDTSTISFYNIGAEIEVIELTALITKENGCQYTETLNYVIPKTIANDITARGTCGFYTYNGVDYKLKYEFDLTTTNPDADTFPAWNTFTVNNPEELVFVRNGTKITVYITNSKLPFYLNWSVTDNRGFSSTVGKINLLTSGLCPEIEEPVPNIPNPDVELSVDFNLPAGETDLTIPRLQLVPDSDVLNLEFATHNTQTVVGDTLNTYNGTADFTPTGDIQYVRTSNTVPVDIVRVQGERLGRPSQYYNAFIKDPLFIDYTPSSPSFTATLADNSPTSNVLVGDWDYFLPETFIINTAPTLGVLRVDEETGLLTYFANTIGNDSFSFSITDIYGNVIGPVSGTSTYTSPGTGRTVTLLTGSNVDLDDYLIGPYSTGGAFTVSVNGGPSNPVVNKDNYPITSPVVNTVYYGNGGRTVVFPAKHEITHTVAGETTVIEINSKGEQLDIDVFEINYNGTPELLRIEGTDPDAASLTAININVDDGTTDTDYTVDSFINSRFIKEIQLAASTAYAITITTENVEGYVKSIVLGLNT